MTDVQKPVGESSEAPVAEQKAAEVPEPAVPVEKKAETIPNAPVTAEETVKEEKAVAVPVQPAMPVEDKEVAPVVSSPNPAPELPAEPVEAAETHEDVTEKLVDAEKPKEEVQEVKAAEAPIEVPKEEVSDVPVVEEKVQPPAEDTTVAAAVEEKQAAPEIKPEAPIEEKAPEPVTEAKVEPEVVVEKEVVETEPPVEKPATSVVPEEKKDVPTETKTAEIEKPAEAEVKPAEPASVEKEVAEPKLEEQLIVAAPQKELAVPEAIQEPAEVKKEAESKPEPEKVCSKTGGAVAVQRNDDLSPDTLLPSSSTTKVPDSTTKVPELTPDQSSKKTPDGPAKTSVTLPPNDMTDKQIDLINKAALAPLANIEKPQVNEDKNTASPENEEYWKNNMPEGHSFDKVRQIFYAFDHDLSGNIAMCELADALRCCGLYVSQKEVHKLKLSLKLEHQRVVSFGQFYQFLKLRKKDSVERLTKAFMRFDKQNTGYVDTIELRKCLTTMGEALTESQVDDMLEGLDINADGQVEFQEFVNYMLSDHQM